MIVLGVGVELAQLDQLGLDPLVERLAGLGVGAIEAQLLPEMRSHAIARWGALIDAAARHELAVSFHVPWWPEASAWRELLELARPSPSGVAPAFIVHGSAGPHPDPALVGRTVDRLRRLADSAPDMLVALENGANIDDRPVARLRAWAERRRRKAAASSRPSGVGSGMGAALPVPVRAGDEAVDAEHPRRPRHARWNAAGSRQSALNICASVERSNCVLAWDLAHDWIAGRSSPQYAAVPDDALLQRVGYVRVHDVDDGGRDHCLLVMGNVPYTTQLRALLAAGYAGTVCLAVRYTAAMRPYGGRWQALERSLHILRQSLKLV